MPAVVSHSRSTYLRYYRFYSAIPFQPVSLSTPLTDVAVQYMLGTEDLKYCFLSCVAPTLASPVKTKLKAGASELVLDLCVQVCSALHIV